MQTIPQATENYADPIAHTFHSAMKVGNDPNSTHSKKGYRSPGRIIQPEERIDRPMVDLRGERWRKAGRTTGPRRMDFAARKVHVRRPGPFHLRTGYKVRYNGFYKALRALSEAAVGFLEQSENEGGIAMPQRYI